jgi:hypothetical protein
MTLQEKDELLIQGECLIEVTAWAGLTSKTFIMVDKFFWTSHS